MTAIAGLWDFAGRGDVAARCDAMLAAQAMYGSGAPRTVATADLALGRDLYHLLPEDRFDRQPLVSPDGRHSLVADVRIDNRDEIAAALGLTAADAASLADSELLFRALLRWSEGALDRLVGDFAFAFFDANARSVMLARDALGQRPLFWHRGDDFFAFASMPKGMHALPDIALQAEAESVARYLNMMPQQGDSSFFAGIHRVPPGHVVTVTHGGVASRRYWNPRRQILKLASREDYVAAFRHQLDQAVACRSRRIDGPVASHLSGGWDSSAVTATAARLLSGEDTRVIAYTSVPRRDAAADAPAKRFADEGPLARATAALYANVDHVELETPARSPVQGLASYVAWFDRPPFNPCNHPWLADIRADARSRGARVLLTGEIGNWTISAAPNNLLADLLREGRWREWARQARSMIRERRARLRGVLASSFGPWLPRPVMALAERFSSQAARRHRDVLTPTYSDTLRRDLECDEEVWRRRGYFDNVLQALSEMDFGEYRKGILGGWGIDKRDATADRRLIEFCLSLPLDMLLDQGERRPLARRALADRLPAEVLDERRKGYQNPDWSLALTADRDSVRRLVDKIAADAEAAAIIDVDALRRLLRDWPAGGWSDPRVIAEYRGALLRALAAGRFVLNARAGPCGAALLGRAP